jgi:hypothetical protein
VVTEVVVPVAADVVAAVGAAAGCCVVEADVPVGCDVPVDEGAGTAAPAPDVGQGAYGPGVGSAGGGVCGAATIGVPAAGLHDGTGVRSQGCFSGLCTTGTGVGVTDAGVRVGGGAGAGVVGGVAGDGAVGFGAGAGAGTVDGASFWDDGVGSAVDAGPGAVGAGAGAGVGAAGAGAAGAGCRVAGAGAGAVTGDGVARRVSGTVFEISCGLAAGAVARGACCGRAARSMRSGGWKIPGMRRITKGASARRGTGTASTDASPPGAGSA